MIKSQVMQNVTVVLKTRTSSLRELCLLVGVVSRHDELNGLMEWAQRKRLAGVRQVYVSHLIDEEQRLFRATVRTPGILQLAHFVHSFKKQLSPTPRYYRGYAAKYRRHNYSL